MHSISYEIWCNFIRIALKYQRSNERASSCLTGRRQVLNFKCLYIITNTISTGLFSMEICQSMNAYILVILLFYLSMHIKHSIPNVFTVFLHCRRGGGVGVGKGMEGGVGEVLEGAALFVYSFLVILYPVWCNNRLFHYFQIELCCPWTSGTLFTWHGLTSIPAWISNHIHYNVWDEKTYPFHSQTAVVDPLTLVNG